MGVPTPPLVSCPRLQKGRILFIWPPGCAKKPLHSERENVMGCRAIIGSIVVSLLSPAVVGASDFQFNKVVDTTTPVPGGAFGNFTDVRLVASDGPNVAFTGTYKVNNV